MIFDSSEGQSEGCEQDKLIYHWTKDAANNSKLAATEQIDDICLCDASIGASIRLGSNSSTSSTMKHDQIGESYSSSQTGTYNQDATYRYLVLTFDFTIIVMIEVEPACSIWIAVHVSTSRQQDKEDITTPISTDYHTESDCIPITAIRQVISNIYHRFRLINGTFQMIKNDLQTTSVHKSPWSIRENLRSICDKYYDTVLPEIHLSSLISNVASLYNYIVYLDLDTLALMKVMSFMNHLVCIDPDQLLHTIAIFNDQLLWSSLNEIDSRFLYNYMVGVLIRDALQEELTREIEKVRRIKENLPIYLTNISSDTDTENRDIENNLAMLDIEQCHEDTDKKMTKLYLTVFRSSNNMTLGLVFKDAEQFDLIRNCEQMLTSDSRLGVIPLASLARSVGQSYLETTNSSHVSIGQQNSMAVGRYRRAKDLHSLTKISLDHKFICLDRLGMSVFSSFDASNRDHLTIESHVNEANPTNRKGRLIRYMIDLEPDLQEIYDITGRYIEEYLVKTTSDTWLTVMNTKYRCIYSIYKMRNAGLIEAQQAANHLKTNLNSTCR